MNEQPNFDDLSYERFRELAKAPGLSRHERVGFPDSYRDGKEEEIWRDMAGKLANLAKPSCTVMEIGPGCSALPTMLAAACAATGSTVYFVDSPEMLALLPAASHVRLLPGAFPQAVDADFDRLQGRVDVIVAYSVVQYVFTHGNLWDFFDRALALLAEGGEMLLGDIPNQTMRKRLFASAEGARVHRAHTGRDEAPPAAEFNRLEPGQMDDSVVLALLARARAQGFHAWVVPQSPALPMSNRREDILVRRP